MLGFLGMLAANVAVCAGAASLTRRWSSGKPYLDALQFMLARTLLISLSVIAAGVAGVLNAAALGIAGVVALAVLRPKLRRPVLPDFGKPFAWIAGAVLLRALLQVWFFAPYNPDALSYHLTPIAEWVRAGGFTREMGIDTHAPFPAGFQLIETWWVVFLHHDVLIEMAGLEFLVLAGLAANAVAREMGLSERASAWAGLLYTLTPGVNIATTSGLNDLAVSALIVTTLGLMLAGASRSWLLTALALGIGIKPTFGYAMPGFLVLHLLLKAPNPGWSAAPLGVAALVPGAFWYARNLLWFGNPIHPVGSKGLVAATGELKIQFGPSPMSGWKNIKALFDYRIYDEHVAYGALLSHISGWGVVTFACGAVGIWGWVRETPRAGKLLSASLVSLVSILGLVNHDDWCLRFVLFFPCLLVVAAVWIAQRVRPMVGVIAVGAAFQFLATMFPVDHRLENALILAKQGWRERSVAPILGPQPPPGAPTLFRIVEPVHSRGESYLLYQPDFGRRVVYDRGTTAAEFLDLLSRCEYVYGSKVNPKEDPLIEGALRAGRLRRVEERLYKVERPK